MNSRLKQIPKDTIVLFSSGEYSDYHVHCLMKAKEDVDPDKIRDEYISLNPEQILNYKFREAEFIKFLEEKNLFAIVDNPRWMEWYLSGYSKISDMQVYDGPILFT